MAPDLGALAAHVRSTYVRFKGGQRLPDIPAVTGPVGPPDFVGIGVQKAGTTWWYDLITAHPDVRQNAAGRKEVHFFTRYWEGPHGPSEASGLGGRSGPLSWQPLASRIDPLGDWNFGADVDAYHHFFPVHPGSITGEWSPRYLADWWGPGCLAAAAPDTRLLVIVRDPVERYCSALTRVTTVRSVRPNDSVEVFQRGCYASQLRRLREWFPASQVLILQYERCVADPAAELRRTYQFLGLDNGFTPEGLANSVNKTVAPKVSLEPSWLGRLRRAYESEVRELVGAYPEIDVRLWANFASRQPSI